MYLMFQCYHVGYISLCFVRLIFALSCAQRVPGFSFFCPDEGPKKLKLVILNVPDSTEALNTSPVLVDDCISFMSHGD